MYGFVIRYPIEEMRSKLGFKCSHCQHWCKHGGEPEVIINCARKTTAHITVHVKSSINLEIIYIYMKLIQTYSNLLLSGDCKYN